LKQKIPVLDSGAQLYAAIGRVCDELGVEPVFFPLDATPEDLKDYKGFIISGSGASVYEPNAPTLHPETLAMMKTGTWKVLGICYGMQLLNRLFGGTVVQLPVKEYGKTAIMATKSPLFSGLPSTQRVLMSHGDSIEELADGFEITAKSDAGLVAAIQDAECGIYGVQFHPEAIPISTHGKQIMANFLFNIAGYTPAEQKSIDDLIEEQRRYIVVQPNQRIICGLSGGVDSSAAAKAVEIACGPERCIGFTIDTGGLRKGEASWVKTTLEDSLRMQIYVVNAEERFLNGRTTMPNGEQSRRLCEESDPKIKRKIFNEVYQAVVAELFIEYGLDEQRDLFLQGTLRPDLIESASKRVSRVAKQIKQHHNVFDRFRKLEPNQNMHKDQVRSIAIALGLPAEIAYRQPFPGPGLFCRTVCADKPWMDEKYSVTASFLEKYSKPRGIEALLLPIKTVGIKGDDRTEEYATVLAGEPNWERLAKIADEIPRVVPGISRVYYLFNGSVKGLDPNALITTTFCTKDVLDQLREADAMVNAHQSMAGIDSRQIEQFPVNMLPINFGKPGTRTIGLRPFVTVDFYTGLAAIPSRSPEDSEHIDEALINAMVRDILTVPGIGSVVIDLTSKPPGTTEVE